jgi:hypothetical protein
MYRNHKVDERYVHYDQGIIGLKFAPFSCIVDVWSDERSYCPATDTYVLPFDFKQRATLKP